MHVVNYKGIHNKNKWYFLYLQFKNFPATNVRHIEVTTRGFTHTHSQQLQLLGVCVYLESPLSAVEASQQLYS